MQTGLTPEQCSLLIDGGGLKTKCCCGYSKCRSTARKICRLCLQGGMRIYITGTHELYHFLDKHNSAKTTI